MAILKYYDGSDWEPVASALVGPTGSAGTNGVTGATGATGPTGSDASSGLILINTTAFSGVSSVSLPNDTFTATYRNYKIIGHFLNSVSDGRLDMRLRAAGSDNTTSNYSSGFIVAPYSSSLSNEGSTGQTIWNKFGLMKSATVTATFILDVYSPFETETTNFTGTNTRGSSGQMVSAGLFNATTSFDSLTFIPEGGTITGTLYVYGYKN
jgi:hypothetical protein